MKRDPRLTRRTVTKLADTADLVWRCEVVASGYHNGAHCRPSEPHGGDWRCGWAWVAVVPAKAPEVDR